MIWSIQVIGYKKIKIELNNIFNSVNFHDFKFSIILVELLNIQMQYEIMANCLFSVTDIVSWDNWIKKIEIWKI